MKEKLNKITGQYKSEYNLDTRIDIIQEGLNCYFNRKGNYIFFAIDFIKNGYTNNNLTKRSGYKDFENNLVFALLHEIHHAIDYKNNSQKFDDEFAHVNIGLYRDDKEYHHSCPFEIRADEFARKELVKWIEVN